MREEDAGQLERPEEGQITAREPAPGDPLASRDARIEELTDDLQRLQAEFENYKKRTMRDSVERSKSGVEAVAQDLLAVLDTFDKALEGIDKTDDPATLKKGLKGIHRQFLQTLQRQGLREVRAEGRFDPFEHEAIMREEREDMADGQILEVYQKGYLMGTKVIRAAKVKVSKAKEPDDGHREAAGPMEDDDHDEQESQNQRGE